MRELAYLQADMEMEYDHGVPEGAAEALTELFHRPELLIEKRTSASSWRRWISPP